MSETTWKNIDELVPGDRIEIGLVVMRVIHTRGLPNYVDCVWERDGRSEVVRRFGDAFHTPDGRALVRYVGPPGSDPLGRTFAQEIAA